MDEAFITHHLTHTFPGVETTTNLGYTFFFCRSERKLPFATLISADNEYDRVSNLNRPGVFRLNVGISQQTFQSLFGTEAIDVTHYDFAALDVIMPHPEYASYHFICVLSPGEATFERLRPLLAEAYDIAARRYARQHDSAATGADSDFQS